MRWWLKIGYFTEAAEAGPEYWLGRYWVSDSPGRQSPRWTSRRRPQTGVMYPPYGPRYEVGDRLVVYLTEPHRCPAILEVTGEPHWDPGRVDQEAKRGEGDRWGVVTPVRGIHAVALKDAPELERIGVSSSSVGRKGHVALEEWQYAEAERLIAGRRRRRAHPKPMRNVPVPIEQGEVEGYDPITPAGVRRAVRREAKLVRDYAESLGATGDRVYRNKLVRRSGAGAMCTDLFNETRNQLIEAKASTSRNDVRMAIGQLADYARFVGKRTRRAVLLEARPEPDLLNLLADQGIAAVWRVGSEFADNANGAFT